MTLTKAERMLLDWLAREEFSQYGECYGMALDGLVEKGLVHLHEDGEHQSRFIAKGKTKMYWAVSLTPEGRKLASN